MLCSSERHEAACGFLERFWGQAMASAMASTCFRRQNRTTRAAILWPPGEISIAVHGMTANERSDATWRPEPGLGSCGHASLAFPFLLDVLQQPSRFEKVPMSKRPNRDCVECDNYVMTFLEARETRRDTFYALAFLKAHFTFHGRRSSGCVYFRT